MSVESLTLFDLVSDIDRWKDKLAVIYDGGQGTVTMTYHQVMMFAEKISSVIRNHTHSPDVIGLCLELNQFVPSVLIGVLQSKNAFLNFVASSFGYMHLVLDQLHVNILFVQSSKIEVLETLLLKYKAEIVEIDVLKEMDITLIKLNRPSTCNQRSLAYCITTSGTTGMPKVVRVPHECIVPNVIYQRKIFKISQDDIVFLSSPLTFDPSIVDIFLTLSSGACLLMTSDAIKTVPNKLLYILTNYTVTVIQCTPTLFSRFDSSEIRTKLLCDKSSLRVLGFGGEKFLPLSVLNHWRAPGNTTKFYNLYGITEVSCWSSIYEVTDDDFRNMIEDIPLGTPMTDTVYWVKDSEGQTVTKGSGTLYIGSCKRICYITDDDDANTSKSELYRCTGDIVNVSHHGDIVYISRADQQVKRNGKRINLAEIEQIVCKVPGVQSCKVLYKEMTLVIIVVPSRSSSNSSRSSSNTSRSSSNESRSTDILESSVNSNRHSFNDITKPSIDIVVTERSTTDLVNNVTVFIKDYLPIHYWPDHIVSVDVLPMTKHGKCDTDALWEAVRSCYHSEVCEDFKDFEKCFSSLWKEILDIKEVNSNSMFTLSGGDSVKAIQLANQIQTKIDKQIPWLLDFILHKSFHDILKAVENVFENGQETLEKFDFLGPEGKSQRKRSSSWINEDFITVKRREKIESSSILDNDSVKLVAKKIHLEKSVENTAEIKCRMKSVSKCNMCSDWIIHEDNTISNFYHHSNLLTDFKEHLADNKLIINNSLECVHTNILPGYHDTTTVRLAQSSLKFSVNEKWTYNTGKCVDASPLIATLRDGQMVVFIGSHSHRFSAIFFNTGQLLWETTLGDRIESSACMTLCGTYVVVGCYDFNLYALSSTTGEVFWKYKVGGEVKSSPVVDPVTSLVIFGSHDHHIHAVDIENKVRIWCTNIVEGSVFASPCILTQPHYVFCATLGGAVAALQGNTGTLFWKFKCGKPVFSSPVITPEGLCFGCVDGKVYYLNFQGDLVWSFMTEAPVFSSPTFADKFLFIGSHDCHMYCISINGNLVWKVKVDSAVYSSGFTFIFDKFNVKRDIEIIQEKITNECMEIYCSEFTYSDATNELLFNPITSCSFAPVTDNVPVENVSVSHNNITVKEETKQLCPKSLSVTFSSITGKIYVVDINTGEIILQYNFPGEVFSSPVVYDDCIVIGCRNNFVYNLKLE